MEKNNSPRWSSIVGYPNYEVSDRGDIRNVRTNKILGRRLDKDGYRSVYLYTGGHGLNQKVHRLVAEAFIEHSDDRDQINHANGNKEDNRVENLEWCTRSENTRHAYNTRLFQANTSPAITAHTKLNEDAIASIRRMREAGISVKEIAKKYDVSIYSIYRVTKRGDHN